MISADLYVHVYDWVDHTVPKSTARMFCKISAFAEGSMCLISAGLLALMLSQARIVPVRAKRNAQYFKVLSRFCSW